MARSTAEAEVAPDALRALIQRYYGGDCRIIAVRRAGRTGAFLFVIDAMQRGHLVRTLGTIGRGGAVMEHSAMDMMRPERLVFAYERAMLAALALVDRPRDVLLLGLGGGAMWRHLDAYLPAARVRAVERDPEVERLAREFFRFERTVVRGDAVDVVADARGECDIVMVDLYDAAGSTPLDDEFWRDCAASLRPGGALAINWAGSRQGGLPRERIERAMALLPGSFLVFERGPRPNLVQLVPTEPSFGLPGFASRWRDVAVRLGLPREDRDALLRVEITTRYPAGRQGSKVR